MTGAFIDQPKGDTMKYRIAIIAALFFAPLAACSTDASALCFNKVMRDGTVIRVCR